MVDSPFHKNSFGCFAGWPTVKLVDTIGFGEKFSLIFTAVSAECHNKEISLELTHLVFIEKVSECVSVFFLNYLVSFAAFLAVFVAAAAVPFEVSVNFPIFVVCPFEFWPPIVV